MLLGNRALVGIGLRGYWFLAITVKITIPNITTIIGYS